ncbi:diacylglycerol/lipid kinase family protein [Varunaivibrio sulfuroxidans]|uniref:YegS/Rv2252/BmrU family lipid kinase n=1 Tax=Varunaivibrio sulfuroxidans TaxID=1773489 RepID=A0A4R3J9F0_9PROT|nr:diacylglycerol kinase family protein [Varunaivibrio sulfuroxidans]TCS62114.1 YegS/Rv2252/BmrU family lipid kinase [Varunaivibrio sulfuroxidans]WES30547.1 diacylglycerol kinase family protein [Varunaivibrio sulfuroxidans]
MDQPKDKRPKNKRRVFIIHNPMAGWRRGALFEETVAQLEREGCSTHLCETEKPGDGEELARGVLRDAWDVLVVAGGDGTINEVLNGMHDASPPLTVIPLGTANVLALELGVINGRRADPVRIARLIAYAPARACRLGEANGRRFAQMAGIGFDAFVVRSVSIELKRRWGKLAYVWRSLIGAFLYAGHHYRVEIDGVPYRASAVVIANGRYYGGRFVCAPEARLDVPGLQVCLFETPGAGAALRYCAALALGLLHRFGDFRVVSAQAARVIVAAEGPGTESAPALGDPVQCDGDIVTNSPLTAAVSALTVEMIGDWENVPMYRD